MTRLAIDTGGTFTDLVIQDEHGHLRLYKAATTPSDPVHGVLDVLAAAAEAEALSREDLLARADVLIHGTTTALNAILQQRTARTALLVTAGHPDILLFREGGRTSPFDHTRAYPQPYIPRSLTFEVPERISAAAAVITPLDEATVIQTLHELRNLGDVEAVAVCLLWAVVNPIHELRVGALIDRHLPGVPYTLAHQLNPAIREYRRASSTAIDASLKPLMEDYLQSLSDRLSEAGFAGRLLIVSSAGGVLDAAHVAAQPIHVISSGPAMAPVAGRWFCRTAVQSSTAIVADAGGTSFDVSLVRDGVIPWTREAWIGPRYMGHMTGFPAVDVKSVGAGGGSIAWVDDGGLLHVGPHSAGADPGPACYARGGKHATVTDAAVTLGYLDASTFLGGQMTLDAAAAATAVDEQIGVPLGLPVEDAAAAVIRLATEHMVAAIEDITVNQGVDPRRSVIVGGGGAFGLNAVAVARRLGCREVVLPPVAAALSAAGALMSELMSTQALTFRTSTRDFDRQSVNAVLDQLESRCKTFIEDAGRDAIETLIELSAEARYPSQIWEIDVPLPVRRFESTDDAQALRNAFHDAHERLFAIKDPASEVEVVAWRATARCRLYDVPVHSNAVVVAPLVVDRRWVYFASTGRIEVSVLTAAGVPVTSPLTGPAIIELPSTTVVLDPGASAYRTADGSIVIDPFGSADSPPVTASVGETQGA